MTRKTTSGKKFTEYEMPDFNFENMFVFLISFLSFIENRFSIYFFKFTGFNSCVEYIYMLNICVQQLTDFLFVKWYQMNLFLFFK